MSLTQRQVFNLLKHANIRRHNDLVDLAMYNKAKKVKKVPHPVNKKYVKKDEKQGQLSAAEDAMIARQLERHIARRGLVKDGRQ